MSGETKSSAATGQVPAPARSPLCYPILGVRPTGAAISRATVRAGFVVAGLGAASGWFGAYCYYSNSLRSLSHSTGLWVLLALGCSVRRTPRVALVLTIPALVLAVVTFYVSKNVVFGSYSVDLFNLALWTVAAVGGGAGLAVIGSLMNSPDWTGALAAALAVGLLLGDGYARVHDYGFDKAALLDTIGAAVVLAYSSRSGRQLARIMVAVAPMALLGYGLVSVPNWAQQIVLEGW